MRIVMRYTEGDGCTYSCENIHPIEYESCEDALIDFEKALKVAGFERFNFADMEFWGDTFYHGNGMRTARKYCPPEFLTVDEWFGENL